MKQKMKTWLALVTLLAMLASCAALAQTATPVWDGEYDVVVVGFGAAGAVASMNVADAGASVLMLEKAPEGHEGGNSRYSGQMFAYGNEDYEGTLTYYKALGGTHEVPEAMLKVYCEKIATMKAVVAEQFALDMADFREVGALSPYTKPYSPEYPELAGSDTVELWATHEGFSDGYLWQVIRQRIQEKADVIDVWFESPATHLIQDPVSKTILGVEVERGGETLRIRAKNGVVLACGGFENNAQYIETYLGISQSFAMGTLYNTGDGLRMAMEVGADLWHMHVYEGMGMGLGSTGLIVEEGQQGNVSLSYLPMGTSGSSMLVNGGGKRFLNEAVFTRHGHIDAGDMYANPSYPENMYLIIQEEAYGQMLASGKLPADYAYHYSADTVKALAQTAGIRPEGLDAEVARFNSYAANGEDLQFGRAGDSMTAFEEGVTLHALKMVPAILNTQGGARRNENAQVLDVNGSPIPQLYSAGEFGGICSLQYQGGSNIAETIIFGQIAGQNAAAEKAAVDCELANVDADALRFTLGVQNDLVKEGAAIELADNQRYGEGQGMGGAVGVVVTLDGEKITSVEVVLHHETEGICEPAIEAVPARIVENNTAAVDTVAGATITSKAIIQAVEAALAA